MDWARLLRAARRARRLSQREVAEIAGVPASTVGRIEAGAVTPRIDTVVRLVNALELRIAIVDDEGTELVLDDEQDRLRDAAGRRFPAHLSAVRTGDLWDPDPVPWWGWWRISWPFGVGAPVPEYTFWRRPRRQPRWQPKR